MRYEKGATRYHVVPSTPLPADTIPKLTRGGLLVDQLVQATITSAQEPRHRGLLQAMAERRLKLEAYITKVEKEAGVYTEIANTAGGRPSSKGWGVSKTRHGKWRLTLTSMVDGRPRRVGIYKRRIDAEDAGRAMIAKLRGEAA